MSSICSIERFLEKFIQYHPVSMAFYLFVFYSLDIYIGKINVFLFAKGENLRTHHVAPLGFELLSFTLVYYLDIHPPYNLRTVTFI